MSKRITIFSVLVLGAFVLSGCGEKDLKQKEVLDTDNQPIEMQNEENESAEQPEGAALNVCQEENINLPNYGDPAKRLKNCFVKYPGEPSRQDKSYYIVEDICGQFTREFVENALGQKIIKTEPPKIAGLNNCSYFTNDKDYFLLNLEYLKIENQKTFYQQTGGKVEKDLNIPMDNVVIIQDDVVTGIYFVLSPEKFISLRPSSKNMIDNAKFLEFAAKIGKDIKDYK